MSMSSTSFASAVDALLVRDIDGQYRPARAEEVPPQAVKDHLRLELGVLEHEVFCVLFVDAQRRISTLKQLFLGTVSHTSVYPREVAKEALSVNAAAVGLAHNDPSRSVEPSRADEVLTRTLKTALALIDVRVLDQLVVAGADVRSFAERGLV